MTFAGSKSKTRKSIFPTLGTLWHGDEFLFVFVGGIEDLVIWLCGNGFVDLDGDVLVNGVEFGDGFVDVVFGGDGFVAVILEGDGFMDVVFRCELV